MKKTLPLSAVLVSAALLGATENSAAQSFNLDLGDPASMAGVPAATYGAAASQPGVWNALGAGTVFSGPIVDLAGMSTPIMVDVPSLGTPVNIDFDNLATSGDDQALLDDLVDPTGGDQLRFMGLANGSYRIFTYGFAPDNPTFVGRITIDGVAVDVGGTAFSGVFTEGDHYSIHCVQVTNGEVIIQGDSVVTAASINGVQFVQMMGPCPPMPGDFVESCSGDGGDQMGCTDCPCGNNAPMGTIGGCLNSTARSARLIASGGPSVSNDTLRMEMSGGTNNSFGILSSGPTIAPASATNPCFGLNSGLQAPILDGLRCAVAGVQRHGTRPSDANGDIGLTTNGWGPPNGPVGGLSAMGGFVSGETRHFQIIYREMPTASCGTGQNTTQAVTVVWVP